MDKGATFLKGLDPKLLASRRHYCTEGIASTKDSPLQANDCAGKMDYLELVAISPGRFTYDAEPFLELHMPYLL